MTPKLVEFAELLLVIGSLLSEGVLISGLGLVGFSLQKSLSRYTPLEEPDPTMFKRAFGTIFRDVFDPVGRHGARRFSTPILRQTSFLLSVGTLVLLMAVAAYVLVGGALVGTVLVTHQASILNMEVGTIFQKVVAFVVLISWIVMVHAQKKAENIYNEKAA